MKILLPVDGSDASLDAVQHALGLVRDGLRAEFVLANVQEPASLYELLRAHDAEVIESVSRSAGEHLLERAAGLCRAAAVGFETVIGTGEPAHLLHDIAEETGCELIVMGARGDGNTRGTRLGSVAHAMLHDAALPVTIVRHRDAEEGEQSSEGE
jgi:nucleotide-binding universal stress UspA family protein